MTTRREKRKLKERRARAHEYARQEQADTPRPSEFGIRQFDPDNPPDEVHLYGRCSSGKQDHGPQLRRMRRQMDQLGVAVPSAAGENVSGKSLKRANRKVLFKQLEKARDGCLLVVDTSRVVRPKDFHAFRNPTAGPTKRQLERLEWLARKYNVTILTLNDPDASPEKGRALLDRINRQRSKAGRPRKRPKRGRPRNDRPGKRERFRERWLPKIKEWIGWRSLRQMARVVSKRSGTPVSKTTIARWLKR